MKTIKLYKAVKDNQSREALLELLFAAANGQKMAFVYISVLKILAQSGEITDPVCVAALSHLQYTGNFTKSFTVPFALRKIDGLDDAMIKAFGYEFGLREKPVDIMQAMYWHFVSTNLGGLGSAISYTRIYLWHHAFIPEFDSNPNQLLVANMIGWNITLSNNGVVDAATMVAFLYQILALKCFKLEVSDAIWWLDHAKGWINEARKWLEVAVEKGSALGALNLGLIYLLGAISKEEGIAPNIDKSIQWLEKSYALGGNFGAMAAHHISHIYFSEIYNKSNQELGEEWHEKFIALSRSTPRCANNFLYTLLLHLYCTPFTTPGSWRRHFLKHGEELGCADANEYQELAVQVQKTGTPILYCHNGRDTKAYIQEISDDEVIFVAANDNERIRTCHLKNKNNSEDMTRIIPRPTSFFANPMLPTVSFGR